MRLLGWQVQPVIMIDDGEHLEQAHVQPQFIAARQWDQFKNGGDEAALAELRTEAEDPPPAPGAPRATLPPASGAATKRGE